MSAFWSPLVHSLKPYVPGEQPKIQGLVKLNTNEHPLAPSPRVLQAIRDALGEDGEALRLYPDPESMAVRQAAAASWPGLDLTPQHIFVGNGSDEVLAFAFQGLLARPGGLAFPDITYSFYPVYCGLYQIEARLFPVGEDLSLDLARLPPEASGLICPNPNAPTGLALPRERIEAVLRARPDLMVVVDEAYVDFGAESCVPLVPRYPNLLVTQSFSKSRALAGMRIGLAYGQPALIEALVRIKDSFNSYPIDRLAQAAAVAAIEDTDWLRQSIDQIIETRLYMVCELRARGFDCPDSAANFVFARVPQSQDAKTLAAALREAKIIVRHFATPRIADRLRITVGTRLQAEALISALDQIL